MSTVSACDLGLREVALWFEAKEDKQILVQKLMKAKLATTNCCDQVKATREWSEICEVLRELHDDFSFVCETMDTHTRIMEDTRQRQFSSVVHFSTSKQAAKLSERPAETAQEVTVGGMLAFHYSLSFPRF
jgi:hypothetical protein